MCTETPSSSAPNRLPTLSSLMPHTLKGKRKRSITHFDGIPLSVLPLQTPSPPTPERRIVTLRRAMGLYKTMSGVSISGKSLDSKSVEDMQRDAYHFACHYMNNKSSSIKDDSEDDRESSTEGEDSDDEDDVVLVFSRPY